MLKKFEPKDVVALVSIAGGFLLLAMHVNGVVSASLLAISAYYFGHQRLKES